MKLTEKMKNSTYPDVISNLRRPVAPPKNVVNNGIVQFGTFDAPLENINIIDCKKPVKSWLPKFMNSSRIKEWEAFEISFDEGFLVGAIYDVGAFVFNIIMFFDKKTKEVSLNQVMGAPKKVVKDTLINKRNNLKTGNLVININNQFQDGKCYVKANSPKSKKNMAMNVDVELTSISMPSVVVMPLGENRPLYSQKELFKVSGNIQMGDRTFTMNENSLAIIDDHKGYYPYKMHYDWLTGMGTFEKEGVMAFNLTKNQVTNPKDYNENYLWLNGDTHPLPPVNFTHLDNGHWKVTDEHDMVNIEFHIDNTLKLDKNVALIKVRYRAPFGFITGYIKDIDGNKHILNGAFGMGEDKTYQI